jgi:hypothetical protein
MVRGADDCAVQSLIASPFFGLSAATIWESLASPLARSNRKAQSHYSHARGGNSRLRLQETPLEFVSSTSGSAPWTLYLMPRWTTQPG